MCCIAGHIGKRNTKEIPLEGLEELEYRGYDSAGICLLNHNAFHTYKAVGKLSNLVQKALTLEIEGFTLGIGHTRWATHGKPTEQNAHSHNGKYTYIVHNGIIENYQELKKELEGEGIHFQSQTDTEVFVHLFEKYQKDINNYDAFIKALERIEGAYAILLVIKSSPDTILFAMQGSPLILGIDGEEKFFASSDAALLGLCENVHYFEDGEHGYVTAKRLYIETEEQKNISFQSTKLPSDKISAQKDGYRYFMEKEIYEQSEVLSDALRGRVLENSICFNELDDALFEGVNEIKLKEISYLHAEGYPAGEMKQALSLLRMQIFTIALLSERHIFEKMKSNIEELGARDATICCVSAYFDEKADDHIMLQKRDHYMLEFYEMMVATQLLAMEISIRLGKDVDMPRNLAKSVTVE